MNIFIAYARKDADSLKELKAHLKTTESSLQLKVWYDEGILPGQDWSEEVKKNLENSNLILLLISKDFFNSDFIEKTELTHAFERYKKGLCAIVPIIVRSCVWEDHDQISRLQFLPDGALPVYSSHWHNQDDAWTNVVIGIKKIVASIRGGNVSGRIKTTTERKNITQQSIPPPQRVRCKNCNGSGRVQPLSVLLSPRLCPVCKGAGEVDAR